MSIGRMKSTASQFDDLNGNHVRDPGEPGIGGVTVYIDTQSQQFTRCRRTHHDHGRRWFVRVHQSDARRLRRSRYQSEPLEHTYPTTVGGILWPSGVSNPASGNVSPTSITTSLAEGESHHETVSLTLPGSGGLTNLVDVFLLFDDTGSFVNNSPIVRSRVSADHLHFADIPAWHRLGIWRGTVRGVRQLRLRIRHRTTVHSESADRRLEHPGLFHLDSSGLGSRRARLRRRSA